MHRRIIHALCLALLAVALAGLVAVSAQPGSETSAGQRGQELYLEFRCGVCHHLERAGTRGTFAPPHDALAIVAAARIQDPRYRGNARTAAEYVRESITDPQAFVVPGYALSRLPMPAFRDLSEADLDALVRFLLVTASQMSDKDGAAK